MSHAFLIVVSVALAVKLIFLSLSMYFTMKYNKEAIDLTQTNTQTKSKNKSMLISWREIPRKILPKSMYCPNTNTKDFPSKS